MAVVQLTCLLIGGILMFGKLANYVQFIQLSVLSAWTTTNPNIPKAGTKIWRSNSTSGRVSC